MSDYIISSETTCDLDKAYLDKLGVSVISMEYFINGEGYGGEWNREMDVETFYAKMREGAKTSTSMVNEAVAEEYFRKLLEQKKDVLHVAFAKACSGTYDCLCSVAERLNKEYDNKVYVLDSKCESTGEGLLVELACNKKKEGKGVKYVYEYLSGLVEKINLLFTVDNLKYLAAGGRVSKSSALIGNIAKIKPLLYVDETGKLTVGGKTIGRKISLAKLASMAVEKFTGEYGKIYVSHADCVEDAEYVKEKILSKLPDVEVVLEKIGFVIGSHSGPGTIAIFFVGKKRSF
ncbi:MAG: DegV family protein [Clostridia bacterium]|nr:DegV family protein [Clostridia bacterium]